MPNHMQFAIIVDHYTFSKPSTICYWAMFHSKLLHCQSAHTNQHFTPRATLACQATFRARQARCQDDLSRLHAPFTVDLRGWMGLGVFWDPIFFDAFDGSNAQPLHSRKKSAWIHVPHQARCFPTQICAAKISTVFPTSRNSKFPCFFSLSKPPFLWMRSPVSWWFICSYPSISFYVPISID